MNIISRFLLLTGLLVSALPAAAQGRIRGLLLDSLRGGVPVPDATVELVGSPRPAETDRRGRFTFTGVPAGVQVVRYRSPMLDSLGLESLEVPVTVPARGSVQAAIVVPPLAAFQRRYCGTELGATGIVLGRVTDPAGSAAAGVGVSAIWDEAVLQAGEVAMETRATLDTTAATGFYALCGLPTSGQFVIRAADSERTAGDQVEALGRPTVVRRDLRVGDGALTTVVTGRAVAPRASSPIQVEIWGDTTRSVAADSTGFFRLVGVPRRSGQLYLRAVGQTPRVVPIDPTGPTLDVGEIRLEMAAVALLPMTIRARELTRERLAFEERSRGAVGVFYDSAFLASVPRVTASVLASKSTMLRAAPMRGGSATVGQIVMLRFLTALDNSEGCYPRVYLNGVANASQRPREVAGTMQAQITPDYMQELLRLARRIEIYSAQQAPAEFPDPDGCGSLVIWTR